jgi:hypothetical protein
MPLEKQTVSVKRLSAVVFQKMNGEKVIDLQEGKGYVFLPVKDDERRFR